MAAFNKFNDFVNQLGLKKHELNADTIKVMLSNTAPAAANTVKADITEIAAGNGYVAGGVDTQNTYTTASGVGSCIGVDVVITAAGGTIGPFRYAVIYNDTQTTPAKPLVGWWDYGSSITLNDAETFTIDFGASMFTVT